jgi:hypothetical protein
VRDGAGEEIGEERFHHRDTETQRRGESKNCKVKSKKVVMIFGFFLFFSVSLCLCVSVVSSSGLPVFLFGGVEHLRQG